MKCPMDCTESICVHRDVALGNLRTHPDELAGDGDGGGFVFEGLFQEQVGVATRAGRAGEAVRTSAR
jgi:hypothetical protein